MTNYLNICKIGTLYSAPFLTQIKDQWIDDIETMGEKMDKYINALKIANDLDFRFTSTMEPTAKYWRKCSTILSRRDLSELMMAGCGEAKRSHRLHIPIISYEIIDGNASDVY